MATSYDPTAPGTLVSRKEIGKIIDRSRARVHQILEEADDFPRPIDVLWDGTQAIWLRSEVEEWAKANGFTEDAAAASA